MTNDNIKVAIIEPVGGHGGMDYYDIGLCDGLTRAGIDVVLYTCDETAVPVNARFEVRLSYSGIFGAAPYWLRGLRYLKGSITALLSAVRERRSICHFHLFHVGVLEVFNIALARLLGRRVVITAHDVESFVGSLEVPALSRWAYRRAHRVLVHNRISRKELVNRIGIDEAHISVIPHGNYLHALRPLPATVEARRALEISADSKVILFFGQIKEVKGLDLLLDAMPGVLERHPNAILLIAGKPWKSDFTAYEEIIDRNGIRNHCSSHIRYIPDEELPDYYAAADIVVLPYRRIYQSGVVLMAMSYEKPVLVSDLEGMTEIIDDGESGLVFRQGNIEDLTAKLNIALEDSKMLARISKNGYSRVYKDYDWKVIGEKTRILYSSVVERV